MREIKFRAWDKVFKKYYYDGNLENGDVMVLAIEGKLQFSSRGTYHEKDFIIEQFTGFQDSEGKDIYEGDIVGLLFKITDEETENDKIVCEKSIPVEWFEDMGWIGIIYDYADCGAWTLANLKEWLENDEDDYGHKFQGFKIIGNIHEKEAEK